MTSDTPSTGRVVGTVVAVVVAIILIPIAVWGFNVATAPIKGQGDGVIVNNSADNWIKQQGKFEDLYAEYEVTLFRIQEFKAVAEANPNDAIAQTNLQGQIGHCSDVVAEYNAASRSFISQDWKSIDLPPSLNVANCSA